MKFAIIGAGNTGHAISAYLASKNAEVTLYTRDPAKAKLICAKGITSEGGVNGTFPVKATADLADAVNDVEYIIIMTRANAHREIAVNLKPLISSGQTVIVFNSNWGALEFVQVLKEDVTCRNLTIAETSAQLFIANSPEPGVVRMNVKAEVGIAASDISKTAGLVETLSGFFPQFKVARSIIETTMATTNPVIHVPITIFNACRVENAQPFLFYTEGVSHKAIDLILKIDQERIAVAKALGFKIDDVLTGINSFWPIKYDNLFDALTKNESYQKTVGPKSLDHRFITEDVPFGIAPISRVGKLYKIPTPYTDALLNYLEHVLPRAFVECKLSFSKEDFSQ